ncbi:ATP-binding protein, partial [Frankia sp. CiP3]|uniref:ATP-binding protein n=1 Tax=Frankia sp. CiP3 TaxID=2880971 RepID=UPI001EF4FD41
MTAVQEPTRELPMRQSRQPKRMSNLTLAAVPTVVGCSRMFVNLTLQDWGVNALRDTAELIISELVTNAVKSTGVMDESPRWTELTDLALIYVRVVLLEDGVIIEVADRDHTLPAIPEQDLDAEGGRGLFLVESMSKRWNSYVTDRGKVVWSELEIPQFTASGLPQRVRKDQPANPVQVMNDPELLRQVREG